MLRELKSEPDQLDPGRGFDVFVTDDEIERGSRRRFRRSSWSGGRRRGRCTCTLLTRRPFVLFISHVQNANDIKLLGRAGDLIQHLSCGARGGSEG